MKNLQFCLQLLRSNVAQLQRGIDIEMPNFRSMEAAFGICDNIADIGEAWPSHAISEVEKKWMQDKFQTWPKYSGYRRYPVPYQGLNPETAYSAYQNLWVGEYGSNRIHLLDYLLEQLQNESSLPKATASSDEAVT